MVILGYHGVGDVPLAHDPKRLYVGPDQIRAHVAALRRRGYELVTMRDLAQSLDGDGDPRAGLAALTFDDGTRDHATLLPDLLSELGVPGTVYVCAGLFGAPYPSTASDAGIRYMDEAELLGLAQHPLVEIGSHTNDHYELHEADRDTAFAQMRDSKRTLESLLGIEVVSFCYPRCHYSEAARDAAGEAGYESAVTCGTRGSWNRYELKREVFHSGDGPLVSALRLRGRYAALGTGPPARLARAGARGADRVTAPLRRRAGGNPAR